MRKLADLASVSPRRRTDFLENEHARGRLSELAVAAGRVIEASLERAIRFSGSALRDRVDVSANPDNAAVDAVEAARHATRTLAKVESVVGKRDARLLQMVLGDHLDFAEIALREGDPGERGKNYVAHRIRHALEDLAAGSTATGSIRPQLNDSYAQEGRSSRAGRC